MPAGVLEVPFEVAIADDDVIEPWQQALEARLVAPERNAEIGLGLAAAATVTVLEGVCDNTPAVRDAVVDALGLANCADAADPTALTQLSLANRALARLKPREFFHMEGLETLRLAGNALTELPREAFRGALETLDLADNRLRQLAGDVFLHVGRLRELRLDGNALTALPAGIFHGLTQLEAVALAGNPGAPFPLVLELGRADAEPWNPRSPATVFVSLAQGAPVAMDIGLDVEGGSASSTEITLSAGYAEAGHVAIRRVSAGVVRARLLAPPQPGGRFSGLTVRAGDPLLLFKARPRVVAAPPAQTLASGGDAIVLDLGRMFADHDSRDLAFAASASDESLAAVAIDGDLLTITPGDDEGVLTVTVTATDADGLSATLVIRVTVAPAAGSRLRSWWFHMLPEDD